jgi:hypothetical protein
LNIIYRPTPPAMPVHPSTGQADLPPETQAENDAVHERNMKHYRKCYALYEKQLKAHDRYQAEQDRRMAELATVCTPEVKS